MMHSYIQNAGAFIVSMGGVLILVVMDDALVRTPQ